MDSDIKRPKKQEIDTSSLDTAREELLLAIEAGTIHEGRAEDGLEQSSNLNFNVEEDTQGVLALSSTLDNAQSDVDDPLEENERKTSYRAPLVDIASLPTERSRNQNNEAQPSNVHINKSQSSRIRNSNIETESMSRKRSKKSPLRLVLSIIAILILVLVILCSGAALWYNSQLSSPCPSCKQEFVGITISSGSSSAEIAELLEREGLIKSALAFQIYVRITGKANQLRIGAYEIEKSADVETIVKQLCEGTKAVVKQITFIPGSSITAAKQVLLDLGYAETEIEAAFNKQYDMPLFAGRPEDSSIEGYIYGDTYEVYADASVEDILTQTVFPAMWHVIDENNLVEKFEDQGLTLYEGINLASIVQKEAGHLVDDMPAIAEVFYNRLENNQVLGSDAVIGYRADQIDPNRDRTDLSYLDSIGCPWNSRKCAGLPPSPIATPGKNALIATAEPAEHNYFYFLAGDDGKIYYATTEAEHISNTRNYCQKRCQYM